MTEYAGPGPGDIYGNNNVAFLVIEHNECGCTFIRVIALVPTPEYSYCELLPHREDEVGEFFFNSGYCKLGNIEPATTALMNAPQWVPSFAKKKKKATKRKG
jgi:hypothetical protein